MKHNLLRKAALAALALAILSQAAVMAKTPAVRTVSSDEEIVKAIYDKMKEKFDDQIIHINVRSKEGVVTIEGWTKKKSQKKDIEKLAKKTTGVKSVVNTLTIGVAGGCDVGTKKCGDICIPSTETCNICTARTCN